MNILVCDDDHAIVDAIEIYLSQEGYRVLKAYDGLEAIKMLQEHEIHLILIDIMMPKMDGMQGNYENQGNQWSAHYFPLSKIRRCGQDSWAQYRSG